jgi:protein O-GlcNAc transferase
MPSLISDNPPDLAPVGLYRAWECLFAEELLSAQVLAEAALADDPSDAEALHLLGLVHSRRGNHAGAVALLRKAVELETGNLTMLRNLGTVEAANGQWVRAANSLAKPAIAAPEDHELVGLFGLALLESGRHAEALSVLGGAVQNNPSAPSGLLSHYGRALAAVGRYAEARNYLRRALQAGGNARELEDRLAVIALFIGEPENDVSTGLDAGSLERSFQPETLDTALQALNARAEGDLEAANHLFRVALERGAVLRGSHSVWLHGLLQQDGLTAAELKEEHERWARIHTSPLDPEPFWQNSRDSERVLRIGFLSGEFRCTPMYYFLWPIIRELDAARVAVCFYNLGRTGGTCTERFQSVAVQWRDCRSMAPRETARAIREDKIDILVDLCGHLYSEGLLVHQHRPAPVSVSYPNYQFTTGIPGIQYLVTDDWMSPAGSGAEYCEALLRIEGGCLAWEPPECAPPVTTLPSLHNGFVTFGLFQQPGKYNGAFWNRAAAIVAGTPNSRILIHHAFDAFDQPDSPLRRKLENELTSRGVLVERIFFRGPLPLREHLALLSETDIALDTIPFNGQTTTCECLWMGVPVITQIGPAHVGRVGAALLRRAGLEEYVAATDAEYIALAQGLASDLPKLASVRRSLRQRVAASGLTGAQGVASRLEEGLRDVWKKWCVRSPRI